MTLTCEIAEYQNAPRRLFIQWGKEATSCLARAGNVLENLVVRHFYEFQKICEFFSILW